MSTPSRVLAISLTALLALAVVAVLVLRLAGVPIGLGPEASASVAPSATEAPEVTPTPTATPQPELAAALAEIEAQVRDIRGLPAPDIGPPEIITRADLPAEIEAILDASWTDEELLRANLTLRALGLLAEDQDLRELSARLLEGQVIGFYDPSRKRMVVVSDEGLSALARTTYAHEYTHALQDAAFDTAALAEGLTDDDAAYALTALQEGDATAVMLQWALANLDPSELGEIGATPQPDMAGVPDWMLEQLTWPYLGGYNLVTSISAGAGWGPIDAAFRDPPPSTEQVIHPEKYVAREAPLEVEAPAVAEAMGDGWTELEPDTMGEQMLAIWLRELGGGGSADVAAAGWGGDRLTVATGPDGEWAMAWRIAFDSIADQDQWEAAFGGLDPAGFSGYRHPSDTEVIVLTASSEDVFGRLGDAIGPPAS